MKRAYNGESRFTKRSYYDPMSDSRTPMSQSELADEAEAVFDIVFDEDPSALLQSGAIGKIFDHFKRYGISNDYSDAVDMAIYIEENLLKHSRRANRKGSINEALLKELMDEIVERERETGGWGAGDFNSDIEEVLWRRMTSPHSTKRLQEELGVPINEEWRYDAEGLTDLRFISVREFLHDQRWEDIFDVEHGSRHLSSRRDNRRVAGVNKQDIARIAIRAMDMAGGWEFYAIRHEQGGFEWYLFTPWGELETVRLTDSIDRAIDVAERVIGNRVRSLVVTDEEREQMRIENEEYLRGLKGGSRRSNRRVARDWGDTITELLWHFDAVYGEVGDEAVTDFLWGTDSYGLQYEFDAFMKSAPPSVRERALSRIKTMFKFLKTSHRANRRVSYYDSMSQSGLNPVAGDYALEVFSSVDAGLLVDWFYGVDVPEVDNAVAEWTTDPELVDLVHHHIEFLIMTNLPYESIRVERVTRG